MSDYNDRRKENIIKKMQEEDAKFDIENAEIGENDKEHEHLVYGAILTCDRATTDVKIIHGQPFGYKPKKSFDTRKKTTLIVSNNTLDKDGRKMATVEDHIVDVNIKPFECNCQCDLTEDEINQLMKDENIGEYRKFGICRKFMKLEDNWENLLRDTNYQTFTYGTECGIKEDVECVTRQSALFCGHGGYIYPLTSGQKETANRGKFVGYLAYGCQSITQDPNEGYYKLYDGPTVVGLGEEYMFQDIYNMLGKSKTAALQGYGGSAGLNKLKDGENNPTIRYEGQDEYNASNGVLYHDGIYRHAIAIGPKFQNPYFTYNDKGVIPGTEMIYGTCVDVTIEFNNQTYYIPATIVDTKAHSAPNGYMQTGKMFKGIIDEDIDNPNGNNIIEWYVNKEENGKNKSIGLKQFNENSGIIIYREEVALEELD